MKEYRVVWEIDITAKNMKDAARIALNIQRDYNSEATFFDVTDKLTGAQKTIEIIEEGRLP